VAARLLQHSFEVIGYDIRAEQLEALPLQGLRAAGSIAEAAANTDAVFPILPTLESVEEVVYGPGGLLETASRRTMIIPWPMTLFAWINALVPGLVDWVLDERFVKPERGL